MKNKRAFRILAIIGIAGLVIGGGIGLYMLNMPHRDVQTVNSDFSLTSGQIVSEYLSDPDAANQKYLAADGESKILEVTGTVAKISEDYNGNWVVLLKDQSDKAGVSASFSTQSNKNAEVLKVGQTVTIKGVIRSGASYDDDFQLYENVILEKCDVIKR